jgi:murein DD-endopeptidase MepM/ murein hydrolase activator NlpD
MKITLLKKSNSHGLRKMHFSEWQVISILVVVLTLPFAGLWLGYELAKPVHDKTLASQAIKQMRGKLADQELALAESKKEAQLQLNALTAKIGLMKAELNRINALGQRVAELAKVNKGEFDFSIQPGIGGPMEPANADNRYAAADLFQGLEDFDALINDRAYQLEILESVLLNKELSAEVRISGRPITKGWISSFYGTRDDPFTGKPAWHGGMDFAGKEDGDVIATGAGVVTWAGERFGYGYMIEINHGDGLATRYAHNKEILVQVGDVVDKGEVIAKMGSTGRSTGVHVHYEVLRNGKTVDPKRYVHRR